MATKIGDKFIHKLAFTGKMGAGKSAASVMIPGYLADLYGGENSIAYVISFANPLKQCSLAFHRREKPRVFLQRLGDLARREFGADVFIDIFKENVESLITNKLPELHQQHVAIINDDLRFLNEYEAIKNLGFTVVRIEADDEIRKHRVGDAYTNVRHQSEIEMELIEPDIVIYNNIDEPQMLAFETNLKEALMSHGVFDG